MKRLRKFKPFGALAPYNPATGTFLPLGDTRAFVDYTVVQAGHDALLCVGTDGRQVLVARPWAFRRSAFTAEELDGATYVSTEVGVRTAVLDGATFVERILPDYVPGEKIVAMHKGKDERVQVVVAEDELEGIGPGTFTVGMEDINTAGRRWASGPHRAKVVTIGDNTLGVKLLEPPSADGAEGLDFAEAATEFTIWKPWHLQRQAYDGLTIDGIGYSYSDEQTRTSSGSGDETEIIIPRYYTGAIVLIDSFPGGYCPGGPLRRMFDINDGCRSWAKAFA